MTRPHRVNVPTTYVWGMNDEFLGRKAAQITTNYVTADYRFVELDGGHWLPDTHADDVSSAILERVRS
jgi:pimeloyl-ACP methyl ester carboxylesterase